MITLLHALEWPLAALFGWVAAGVARRRGMPLVEAYALALAPGVVIALASYLFGPANPRPNEQAWQGVLLWCAWAALGAQHGWRTGRRTRGMTRLNLSDDGKL